MKTKAEKRAYAYAWYQKNADKANGYKKRSRARKKIETITAKHRIIYQPVGGVNARRFDLWQKLKSGQLPPDVAARVSKDYANEFAEFEQAELNKTS